MIVSESDCDNPVLKDRLSDLLRLIWPEEYRDSSAEEVKEMMNPERTAVVAVDQDELVGSIGTIPQYGITGWELHPLVVESSRRESQIGTRLVNYLGREVVSRGGITIYLGTGDSNHETTSGQTDLYEHTFDKVVSIQNLREHPYEFYERLGYKIVGALPNTDGWDKSDTWMAKTIIPRSNSQ